ncbi:MAG: hypothetical protein ACRDNB_11920, partial [Gaiellaceae bacterium]
EREGGPARRAALLLAAALGAVALVVAAVLTATDDGDEPPAAVELDGCRGLLADASRECLTRTFRAVVGELEDPRPAVAAIETAVRREGGFPLSNCHGVMHTVGRTYALDEGLTLAGLKDVLPRSNDPGCSAGFAHGLVTGVAPSIDVRRPQEAAAPCADAGTRYRRYSCVHGLGHAFMRIHGDRLGPALELCRALGEQAPDCAQGAYHDYWFAVAGVDDAALPGAGETEPRALCGSQPPRFVRPCWYRAFVDNRPAGITVDSPEHLDVLCDGLDGLQRQACITAASVIGPPDPALQLQICAALEDPGDAASCVRGTKVQNLLGEPQAAFVDLIRRCDRFDATAERACYRWLGKTIAVVTDGAFADDGCPELESEAERLCRDGAASMDAALVTFS